MPLDSIEPVVEATVVAMPHYPFLPLGLMFGPGFASFLIEQVLVGNCMITTLCAGAMPAAVYAGVSEFLPFADNEVCGPGMQLRVDVSRLCPEPMRFTAAAVGVAGDANPAKLVAKADAVRRCFSTRPKAERLEAQYPAARTDEAKEKIEESAQAFEEREAERDADPMRKFHADLVPKRDWWRQ